MVAVHANPSSGHILLLGIDICNPNIVNDRGLNDGRAEIRRSDINLFKTHFGVSPRICRRVWMLLCQHDLVPDGGLIVHLLWALMFLKVYSIEEVLAAKVGCTVKTYMKWTWKFIRRMSTLRAIVVS